MEEEAARMESATTTVLRLSENHGMGEGSFLTKLMAQPGVETADIPS